MLYIFSFCWFRCLAIVAQTIGAEEQEAFVNYQQAFVENLHVFLSCYISYLTIGYERNWCMFCSNFLIRQGND